MASISLEPERRRLVYSARIISSDVDGGFAIKHYPSAVVIAVPVSGLSRKVGPNLVPLLSKRETPGYGLNIRCSNVPSLSMSKMLKIILHRINRIANAASASWNVAALDGVRSH